MSIVRSGTGALRVSAIDVETDDETIQAFLEQTLHAPTGSSEVPLDLIGDQCPADHCGNHVACQVVKRLDSFIQYELAERKLKPGALICFSSPTSPDMHPFLLGVMQKKPSQRTLMAVNFEGNGNIQFKTTNGIPAVLTSHQVLMTLLTDAKDQATVTMKVQVWSYTMKWLENHFLIPCADNVIAEFSVTSNQPRPKNTKEILKPPWMEMPKRPRKMSGTGEKVVRPSARSKPLEQALDEAVEAAGSGHRHHGQSGQSPCDSAEPHEPEVSSSSDTEDFDDRHDEHDGQVDIHAESNPIDDISETVSAERREAKKIALEVDAVDAQKAELAEQYQSGQARIPTSSFFSQELGLDDGAIAVSARSVCLQCRSKIGKGEVRFSWYHSKLRPSSWVHAHCLFQLVQSTGLVSQAVAKLTAISQRGSGSDSGQVQAEARKILGMLQGRL